MVLVNGRLESPLRSQKTLDSVPFVAVLALGATVRAPYTSPSIIGPFLAIALAPLSIMALTPPVTLRSLVLPTRTFSLVFPLTFITTVAGAVSFSVYG